MRWVSGVGFFMSGLLESQDPIQRIFFKKVLAVLKSRFQIRSKANPLSQGREALTVAALGWRRLVSPYQSSRRVKRHVCTSPAESLSLLEVIGRGGAVVSG